MDNESSKYFNVNGEGWFPPWHIKAIGDDKVTDCAIKIVKNYTDKAIFHHTKTIYVNKYHPEYLKQQQKQKQKFINSNFVTIDSLINSLKLSHYDFHIDDTVVHLQITKYIKAICEIKEGIINIDIYDAFFHNIKTDNLYLIDTYFALATCCTLEKEFREICYLFDTVLYEFSTKSYYVTPKGEGNFVKITFSNNKATIVYCSNNMQPLNENFGKWVSGTCVCYNTNDIISKVLNSIDIYYEEDHNMKKCRKKRRL